jgi:pilus assembly protein CpaB
MARRSGLMLILVGLMLAGLTSVLVMSITRQATEASHSPIRQVALVTATRDILDQTTIPADALAIKAFPADFAPTGAIGSPDQIVGKIANGFIPKDQVVVAGQLVNMFPPANLSDRVPPGKVAIWLAMPDLLAGAAVVKPGDRLDILLSVPLAATGTEQGQDGNPTGGASSYTAGLSTQTTLQNVEVFRIGQDELNLKTAPPPGQPGVPNPAAAPQQGRANQPGPNAKAISFLVDHQDAVIIKFIKDSGGTIDLVMRSTEDQRVVRTDAVTMDSLVERFRFRVPQTITPPQAGVR